MCGRPMKPRVGKGRNRRRTNPESLKACPTTGHSLFIIGWLIHGSASWEQSIGDTGRIVGRKDGPLHALAVEQLDLYLEVEGH